MGVLLRVIIFKFYKTSSEYLVGLNKQLLFKEKL
jgi:hypothetical protein